MAVSMNLDVSLEQLGATSKKEGEAAALFAAGAKLQFEPKAMSVVYQGSTLSKVNMNTSALPMYVSGKLGAGSFSLVNSKVIDLLEQAAAAVGAPVPESVHSAISEELDNLLSPVPAKPFKAKAKPKPAMPVHEAEISLDGGISGKISTASMAMSKVKLADATRVYQPVNGSDASSRYFAVALSPSLKVGVRLKPSKLSFRVEGARLKDTTLRYRLQALGLSVNDGYASVHVATENEDMAFKAVGALLMAINHPFNVVATDVSPILNKGS